MSTISGVTGERESLSRCQKERVLCESIHIIRIYIFYSSGKVFSSHIKQNRSHLPFLLKKKNKENIRIFETFLTKQRVLVFNFLMNVFLGIFWLLS